MLPVEHATAKAKLRVLLSTRARGSVWNGRCCSGESLGHRVLSFDLILWALASHGGGERGGSSGTKSVRVRGSLWLLRRMG